MKTRRKRKSTSDKDVVNTKAKSRGRKVTAKAETASAKSKDKDKPKARRTNTSTRTPKQTTAKAKDANAKPDLRRVRGEVNAVRKAIGKNAKKSDPAAQAINLLLGDLPKGTLAPHMKNVNAAWTKAKAKYPDLVKELGPARSLETAKLYKARFDLRAESAKLDDGSKKLRIPLK